MAAPPFTLDYAFKGPKSYKNHSHPFLPLCSEAGHLSSTPRLGTIAFPLSQGERSFKAEAIGRGVLPSHACSQGTSQGGTTFPPPPISTALLSLSQLRPAWLEWAGGALKLSLPWESGESSSSRCGKDGRGWEGMCL